MNETISRFLLAIEAIGLLLPLTLLYGLLFAFVFGASTSAMLLAEPGVLSALLAAGAGLFALWRLLATAVISGIAALRDVHRAWMAFCALIALWVVVAWLTQVWIASPGQGPKLQAHLQDVLLGLYGAPALVPLLHLAAELRWRKGGAA